ncbi:MAG: hypothetical protein F2840_16610 [Actinobacteria bacterium]|nr:hypothetical protein [Actinomycetota bacterium]
MGFTFGLFFGIFGLIAIAAMEPSVAEQSRRDNALAKSIAEAVANQKGMGGDSLRLCPSCFLQIHRQARACPHCGREVLRYVNPTAADGDEGLMIGVTVEGCGEVAVDDGDLLMVVQPGWVTLSVCGDGCGDFKHELVLSSKNAHEMLNAFRGAAMEQGPSRVLTSQGARVLIEQLPGEPDEEPAVMVDWTREFLSGGAQKSHAKGGDAPSATHKCIVVTGVIAARCSEVSIFENALATCADMSSLWQGGQIAKAEVRNALSAIGAVE